jgi:hypothetical protein
MTLAAAVDGLRDAMRTVAGLRRVYDDPPGSINEFPSAIVFASSGELSDTGMGALALHTIIVEVYQDPAVTAAAIDAAKVWPDNVLTAIRDDPTLGGAVAHIRYPITYRMGPLQYNGGQQPHYGVTFNITAKVIE